MYKLASATRADSFPIDNQGPAHIDAMAWTMVQYERSDELLSDLYGQSPPSGHVADSFFGGHQDQLIRNVPEAYRADSCRTRSKLKL